MREIVTLQVGGFANFVGSHFWNFQNELLELAEDPEADAVFKNQALNMDVFYRYGETHQGVPSYTPRLLSVDLQGSLGSMSSSGTLYNGGSSVPSSVMTWDGNVSTQASEPRRRNLFLQSLYQEEQENSFTVENGVSGAENGSQKEVSDGDIVEQLENDVQYWTDYSKAHYHPQSLYELSGLWIDTHKFDNYGIGRDSFSGGLHGEEMSDKLRFFVEECDHIQGFQFIVDDSGGFSPIAVDFLESIADEYTNVPVLLYAVRGPGSAIDSISQKHRVSRKLHDAVSFSRLSSLCKLIVPVGLPSLSKSKASRLLCIKDEKPYHCSAAYAATLHSVSMPFRMEPVGPSADSTYASGALTVNEVVQILSGQARQNMVTILDAAMPAPSLTGNQIEQTFLRNLQPLTPEVSEHVEDLQSVESMIVLGTLGTGGQRASIHEVKSMVHAAYEHAITRPIFSHLSVAQCPLPIPLPFPSIFGNRVGQHGELLGTPVIGSSSRGSLDVHSIPVAARLRSSSAVLPFLENRLGDLRKFGIARGGPGAELLRSWGFTKDESEDMGETLCKMIMELKPRTQTSSDSD
ncbi:PREDICTED: protein misato homolog 1-like [Fragaria vesca subsp. vesca]|uniref:protein misato homolog 1 n=1 Tax=Fragaria vesca subsp. vesca TaxID=101020 RepID=UPI0002C35C45|nr:PREDICTED: protein misato homolog 1 [Fragaria vesca subsp. vesca]XP_011464381.1 PREDICTED: protein misato homolog 1 [Fragaria vesca subsp. vesca]